METDPKIRDVFRAAWARDAEPRERPKPQQPVSAADAYHDQADATWFRNHPVRGSLAAAEPQARIADAGLTRGQRIELKEAERQKDERAEA